MVQMTIGDRYTLHERLGAGSMGAVYRAYDRLTSQHIALKQVLTDAEALQFSSRHTIATDNARLELAHEFQTLASLRHPNIISVQDYGFDKDGSAFFTMALLDAPQTLTDAGTARSVEEKAALIIQLLQGLAYVHRRGVLHRDLKPSNVLVKDGTVHVVDFGLAMTAQDPTADESIAGTIAYMAPEILMNQAPTPQSDLYAVGLMLYELLAGKHPYVGTNPMQLIDSIMNKPIDISVLDINVSLATLLHQVLSKTPTERPKDATEFIKQLAQACNLPLPQETAAIRDSYLEAATFVGRKPEQAQLIAALESANRSKTGSLWLVGGESGVGKSRLLDEIAVRARVSGMLVLRGQAVVEGGVPYQMWRQVVRRLILSAQLNEDHLPILPLIVPDAADLLQRHIPALDEAISNQDKQKRLSLLLDTLFRQTSKRQPLVLVLEDLQWGSDIDKALIKELTPLMETLPIVLLGTYRDDETPTLPQEFENVQTITLTRLNTDEITQLSTSMLGRIIGAQDQVLELLRRETEGNVFFLVEVVRVLAEDAGRISEIGNRTLPSQIFAGGVQRVVQYRLERVPDWAQHMLELAAVTGRQIDPRLISALDAQLDVEAWLTACTNVAVLSAQDGIYRFAHDKLRESLLDALDLGAKSLMHRQVAEGIESAYAQSVNDYAAVLAGHYAEAQDPIKEGYYSIIAGEQSFNVNNYRAAHKFYRRALDLEAHKHAEDTQQTLATIYLGLAKSAYGLSDYEDCRKWANQAIPLFNAKDDEPGYADAINVIGESHFRQSDFPTARRYIEEALAIRRRLDIPREIGYSLMNMGVIESQMGHLDIAAVYHRECYEIMQKTDDKIAIARALNNYAINFDLHGDYDQAVIYYEKSLAIRREINDAQGIAYSLSNLGQLLGDQQELDKSYNYLKEALYYIQLTGEKRSTASVFSALANVQRQRGFLDEAEQHEQRALVIRQRLNDPISLATSYNGLAMIAMKRHDLDTAWTNVRLALQTVLPLENIPNTIGYLLTAAELLYAQKQWVDAATVLNVLLANYAKYQLQRKRAEKLLQDIQNSLTPPILEKIKKRSEKIDLFELARRYAVE